MDIRIDASELTEFAEAMAQAPEALGHEMKVSNEVILHEGVGYAQENAPVDNGDLKNSIRILEGPTAEGGSYGSSLEYAWQREEGGTIYPRNAKVLAFKLAAVVSKGNPEGWVFAKSVTQVGTKYMERSKETLERRVNPIYQLAIDRVLGRI